MNVLWLIVLLAGCVTLVNSRYLVSLPGPVEVRNLVSNIKLPGPEEIRNMGTRSKLPGPVGPDGMKYFKSVFGLRNKPEGMGSRDSRLGFTNPSLKSCGNCKTRVESSGRCVWSRMMCDF